MSENNHYRHAANIATTVHDGLVAWARKMMEEAGLQEIEIWGRFPPEGTVRSYMVLFPYRVGPGPLLRDNSPGTTILLKKADPEVLRSVPWAWREIGRMMIEAMPGVYAGASSYRPGQKLVRNPYPLVNDMPAPLKKWYTAESKKKDSDWVIKTAAGLHGRMPALAWRAGNWVTVHYMAVANDPGRGTSSRMSDAAPLAMPALTVLTAGMQLRPTLDVMVSPRPMDPALVDFLPAFAEAWKKAGATKEELALWNECVEAVTEPFDYSFPILPLNDLNDQEFALLTQALQRPLQAVLNFRVRYPVGFDIEFLPATMVSPMTRKEER